MRRRTILAIALTSVLASREASGDVWHLKSPSEVVTEKGSKLALPPGWFLDEETWAARDAELKQAQEDRTRLKAENDSFRKSADEPPWRAVAVTFVVGLVAGGATFWYLTK